MRTLPSLLLMVLFMLTPLAAAQEAGPLAGFDHGWENDPAWYDGKAECAVYDATRTIYGKQRSYEARLYTNKEVASPETFTKSATGEGREVFKHHLREDIPTENYAYHYSTMAYVGTEDLKSLKLDMGSQEDCGASFKQVINHAGELAWQQFAYFPQMGHRDGAFEPPAGFVFQDALSVVLRGYPFEQAAPVRLWVMPDQTTTKWGPVEPRQVVVAYEGKETLDLPAGSTEAHHLSVTPVEGDGAAARHDYWFAADPATQHIMVQYEGPEGLSYRLQSVERRAYWER